VIFVQEPFDVKKAMFAQGKHASATAAAAPAAHHKPAPAVAPGTAAAAGDATVSGSASMQDVTAKPKRKICVLDFESTCIESPNVLEPLEIIEFPSILLEVSADSRVLTIISEFQVYVKPRANPTFLHSAHWYHPEHGGWRRSVS
jgi:hypothetical protein